MALNEGVVFGGVDLNDGTNFELEEWEPGIAPGRPEWVQAADASGQELVRGDLHDVAKFKARVRVVNADATDMDAALADIGTLVKACQECAKQDDGQTIVWTPAQATASLTGYAQHAEVTERPISVTGDAAGWFIANPVVTIEGTRRPYWYGAEQTITAASGNDPVVTLEATSVPGDVPAEGRLIVTDGASQDRAYVEWGLESRWYDNSTSLLIDSDSLVTSGYMGAQVAIGTSAYETVIGGGNQVQATLLAMPAAVCSTGNLSHIGTFRVKARVKASTANIAVRLSWSDGAGPYSHNDWQVPVVDSAWAEVDLGLVSIPAAAAGTQRWDGLIEAYTDASGSGTDTLSIDYIVLIPAGEGYGKGKADPADPSVTPTAFSAHDEFNQSSGTADGKTLPSGQTWTAVQVGGGGSPPNFTIDATGHRLQRTGGGTADTTRALHTNENYSSVVVQAEMSPVYTSDSSPRTASTSVGLVARYVDTSNYFQVTLGTGGNSILVSMKVGGTYVLNGGIGNFSGTSGTLRVAIDAAGTWSVYVGPIGGTPTLRYSGQSGHLSSTGALASGKAGIWDRGGVSTETNYYDNFALWVPESDAVIFAGQSCEIRSDSAEREDSTGTYYGPFPSYRGSRFYLPEAGSAGRASRILVKAHRNNIETASAANISDSLTVSCAYTPRYVVAPR